MALLFNLKLQNSPYFCVFKYARAGKQKVWNEAENSERDFEEKKTTVLQSILFNLNVLEFRSSHLS